MATCSQKSTKDSHHEQDHSDVSGFIGRCVDGACRDLGAWQCSRCHRSANNLLATAGRFTSVRSPRLLEGRATQPSIRSASSLPVNLTARLAAGNAGRLSTSPLQVEVSASGEIDPNVWTGCALQEGSVRLESSGLAVSGIWVEQSCSWPSWM